MTGQWQLQVGFARALRVAFRHNHQFRWDPDEAKSKVHIYDQFPLRAIRYPSIIIGVQGGPALLRGIGEEIAEVSSNEVSINGLSYNRTTGIVYSGNLRISLTIRVYARSGYERAQIVDWIVLFLRHFAFEKLQNEGVFLEDIQMGPQDEQLVGPDPVYGGSVTVRCLTAFTREIAESETNTVNGICLTGVFSSLPDGTTYGETYV